jgi:hypothetical protein
MNPEPPSSGAGLPDASDEPGAIDFRGSRRLTGLEEWFWYVLAGATYVVAGVWHKWILNWLMGPIWLVTVVVVGPWIFDRVRAVITGSVAGRST